MQFSKTSSKRFFRRLFWIKFSSEVPQKAIFVPNQEKYVLTVIASFVKSAIAPNCIAVSVSSSNEIAGRLSGCGWSAGPIVHLFPADVHI